MVDVEGVERWDVFVFLLKIVVIIHRSPVPVLKKLNPVAKLHIVCVVWDALGCDNVQYGYRRLGGSCYLQCQCTRLLVTACQISHCRIPQYHSSNLRYVLVACIIVLWTTPTTVMQVSLVFPSLCRHSRLVLEITPRYVPSSYFPVHYLLPSID
jgi:hypothetical protein